MGAALAAVFATPLVVVASGGLASRGRGPQFFLLTLLFLGPLGVAAAVSRNLERRAMPRQAGLLNSDISDVVPKLRDQIAERRPWNGTANARSEPDA